MPSPNPTNGKSQSTRTALTVTALRNAFIEHLFCSQLRVPVNATLNDYYQAIAYTVRDRLAHRWIDSVRSFIRHDAKSVSYLSAEYLLGPHLANNLINLDIYDQVSEALREIGIDLGELIEQEQEPGLGNGGLGRLAACFLDSLATLQIPAIGYGIRYEFGIFDQEIHDGWQVEVTDKWLHLGNPWEVPRPDITYQVKFGGHIESYVDQTGRYTVRWMPHRVVEGIAYDTPITGYKVDNCNMLRLWSAEATESFNFKAFNVGDYYGAVEEKVYSENITKILYPNDEMLQGKQLRLEQQYFLVSCSLQDMLRLHLLMHENLSNFHEKSAVQLNDTHPSLAVPELMRLLVDEHRMDWDQAWDITQKTFAYTNHTLLPEALEKWPLKIFADLLPRHLEIIYEINQRFLGEIRREYPGDEGRVSRMSLIDESGERYVRMANLAAVGSHAINGVAELHTELLKETVLKDFYEFWPHKFSNKTNGVTPRRWLMVCNPELAKLITTKIGEKWTADLTELRGLETCLEDPAFRKDWREIKRQNKVSLAKVIAERTGIRVNPDSLFDIQVKRIHEYKRQHLNVLHIITLYNQIKANPNLSTVPRTFIFGGKAAPGYHMAKLFIKLINSVAEVINNDPTIGDRLKVVFFPDFNVKNGQLIYPAADLSEQISTAGKEASGTGNMKFSMNGALTIGTLDGANVEIREEVGAENFFLFGLTAEQVMHLRATGYNPKDYYDSNAQLREVIDLIRSGYFSNKDCGLFAPLVNSLLHDDEYMLFADYQSYMDCQAKVNQSYLDSELWTRKAILNVARIGKFSSDRAILEYCNDIWEVEPAPTELQENPLQAIGR